MLTVELFIRISPNLLLPSAPPAFGETAIPVGETSSSIPWSGNGCSSLNGELFLIYLLCLTLFTKKLHKKFFLTKVNSQDSYLLLTLTSSSLCGI